MLLTGLASDDACTCPLQTPPFVFSEAWMDAKPVPVIATGLAHVLSVGSGTWNESPGWRYTGMSDCGPHSPLSLLRFCRELRAEFTTASTCCSSRASMLGCRKRLAIDLSCGKQDKTEPQPHSSALLGRLSDPAAVRIRGVRLGFPSGEDCW